MIVAHWKDRIAYSLETLVDNSAIPTTEMDKSPMVVKCWRREGGKTRVQSMFLREHLAAKTKEMDAFMEQEQLKRLYVDGPPGCGKTTYFLTYFTQWARKNASSGIIVQYRDVSDTSRAESAPCEIILQNDNKSPQLVISESLDRNSLARLVRDVIAQEHPSFCVFDGVRQSLDQCANVMSVINTMMKERKAIHITSLEFVIRGGEGTGGTFTGVDKYLSVNSWTQGDYEDCARARLLESEEWERLLKTDEDEVEEIDLEYAYDNDTGSTALSQAEGEEPSKRLLSLIERKFYYAGGSARLFFDYSLDYLLKEELPKLKQRMEAKDWSSFASLRIGMKSASSVSSLMQCIDGKVFPVSRHFMYVAYEYAHCKDELVVAMKTAALASGNPAMKGWAFDLEQLHIVAEQMQAGRSLSNSGGNLCLPLAEGALAVYDGKKVLLGKSRHGREVVAGHTPLVITCAKWNQGCFDLAFVLGVQLITVNFTISDSHSLVKVWFIGKLKQSLENSKWPITEITHLAVVNDSNTLQNFKFDAAEGYGYSGGRQLYTIKIARATEFVRPAAACLDEDAECSTQAQLGEHLGDVNVYVSRRSDRKKQKTQPFVR